MEATAWAAAAAEDLEPDGDFEAAASSTTAYLERGESLLAELPEPARRDERQQEQATVIAGALTQTRERFLRAHAEALYAALTDDLATPLRLDELVYRAADRFPGLTPSRAQVAVERERPLAEKEGAEIAQGLLVAHVLASPRAGAHLVWAMLRPTTEALERLDQLRSTGEVDLGGTVVRREGAAGIVELRNPRHLNAEDDTTLESTEAAVDLVLLDPEIEVGVLRGGVVDHPRYAGRRIFGAGINLTHLYRGLVPYLFYLVRDLGYVHKIFRGVSGPEHRPGPLEETTEKLWVAAAETYAIGGACQLLHVVDHVIAERGCRLYLPARKEGIIPGASNLRLPRAVGDRIARQAIVSGREFEAGTPDGDLLCDEVVEPGEMDAALARRVELLTSSGLVNAAANRRALRAGQEPPDVFRAYMATYAREQAFCHFSPALVGNLERNWNAHERRL
jgi:(3,5-dihydroxyphenyl)acetyl-CoA 1,2-dioxygenase